MSAETQSPTVENVVAHARKMSDALIKVRPLGGSELFTRIGEAFYADPVFCGSEIERLRTERSEAMKEKIRAERRAEAAEARVTALEAEKAGLVDERDELREIVNEQFGEELGGDKNLTPIRGSYHTFISWELRRRARQALSRSRTEVKNDER